MNKYFLVVSIIFLSIQCKKKSGDSVSAPSVNENINYGTLYEAILDQSIIYWIGSSATGSHNGILKIKKSNMEINPHGQLLKAYFTIDMNSIANLDISDPEGKKDLEDHLKNEDFFATDTFPEADFILTSATPIADTLTNQLLKGDLTIKGITQSVEFKAQIIPTGNAALITVPEFTIDRTRWGINHQSTKILNIIKDELISDDIKLSMKIVAVKR